MVFIAWSIAAPAQGVQAVKYLNGNKALEGKWKYTGYSEDRRVYGKSKLIDALRSQGNAPIDKGGRINIYCPDDIQLDGPCSFWYEDGTKRVEAVYKNGILNGPLKAYYPNGSLNLDATFVEGFPVGKFTRYYGDGTKALEGNFDAYTRVELDAIFIWGQGNKSRIGNVPYPDWGHANAVNAVFPWYNPAHRYQFNVIGKKNGKFVFYSKKGEQEIKANYRDNQLDGEMLVYRDGGILFRRLLIRRDSVVAVFDSGGADVIAQERMKHEAARQASGRTVQEEADLPFVAVEQMPKFPGDITKYFQDNISATDSSGQSGGGGRVIMKFIVVKDGTLKDIQVVRSLSPALDGEAVRLIKTMPRWKPGKQNGKAVNVYVTLPIDFGMVE